MRGCPGGRRRKTECARPARRCCVRCCSRPMICWIADTLEKCGIGEVCAVLGAGADSGAGQRFPALPGWSRKNGWAPAMQSCRRELLQEHRGGDCAVLYGDAPFVDADTLENAYRLHKKEGNGRHAAHGVVFGPHRLRADCPGRGRRCVRHCRTGGRG